MAFVFSFETLLKQKKRNENIAQREFVEAQGKVQKALNEINKMYSRIDEVRLEIYETQKSGKKNSNYIQELESFITGHKVRIERKRDEARKLMQVAEDKQEVLVEKAKEHKALSTLREKKYKEYRLKLKKRETKRIEDMVTMRFRRSYGQ